MRTEFETDTESDLVGDKLCIKYRNGAKKMKNSDQRQVIARIPCTRCDERIIDTRGTAVARCAWFPRGISADILTRTRNCRHHAKQTTL